MVEVVKRCSFPMLDGYKCNKPFKVSSVKAGVRKYCEEHHGNDVRNAHRYSENKLVTSTNVHAQAGNDIVMREWVMAKIKSETQDEERIRKLEREIERLQGQIKKSESDKKIVSKIVRKELKNPAHKDRVEGIVVKILQSTNKRIKEIETYLERGEE
tara:strand:+ start:645 stop:1115 length:471 start_codon:yes stop_codon:yes gene_type:complete